MLKKLWQDEEGASMTEYGLLIALIGLAAFVVIQSFSGAIKNIFTKATTTLGSKALKAF